MAIKIATFTLAEISFEFLRRVVNELNGRRFEYSEELLGERTGEGERRDYLTVTLRAGNFFFNLPEISREFAAKIKPEFTRCHKLLPPPKVFDRYHTARDPISNVSIRCLSFWDVMESEMMYRFDAAFS